MGHETKLDDEEECQNGVNNGNDTETHFGGGIRYG